MSSRKFWVASGAVVGMAAVVLSASPALAAQKSCTIFGSSCTTGTLPANSSSHSITVCVRGYGGVAQGWDKTTNKKVGPSVTVVSATTDLKCVDVGGLYGSSYYTLAAGAVGHQGYISN